MQLSALKLSGKPFCWPCSTETTPMHLIWFSTKSYKCSADLLQLRNKEKLVSPFPINTSTNGFVASCLCRRQSLVVCRADNLYLISGQWSIPDPHVTKAPLISLANLDYFLSHLSPYSFHLVIMQKLKFNVLVSLLKTTNYIYIVLQNHWHYVNRSSLCNIHNMMCCCFHYTNWNILFLSFTAKILQSRVSYTFNR